MGIVVVNPNSADAFLLDADTTERIDADERIVAAYWQQISRANQATMQLNDTRRENRKLQAENAKLRELVREMYWDLVAEMPESLLEDRLSQMRELGVEVTE